MKVFGATRIYESVNITRIVEYENQSRHRYQRSYGTKTTCTNRHDDMINQPYFHLNSKKNIAHLVIKPVLTVKMICKYIFFVKT